MTSPNSRRTGMALISAPSCSRNDWLDGVWRVHRAPASQSIFTDYTSQHLKCFDPSHAPPLSGQDLHYLIRGNHIGIYNRPGPANFFPWSGQDFLDDLAVVDFQPLATRH